MLASETSGQYPKPNSPYLHSPESDNIFGSIPEFPPDPLLDSGEFINGNTVVEDHSNLTPPETEPMEFPEPSDNVDGEFESPVPLNSALPAKIPTRLGRRKKSDVIGLEPVSSISSEIPEWLPSGWFVEDRVRTSGASAGAVDKYYCDPKSGYKFRSRKEVNHFQQTGSKRKKVLKEKASDDVTPLGNSGNRKGKKLGSKATTQAFNFDFVNVPDKIGWILTDSSEGSWTPFVGDEKVPETSKEEWNATFSSLATKNSGC